MDEKILLLKHFLQSFLVENRAFYGMMSKEVHSLTEQECLDYFDTVKTGIEEILEEKLAQQNAAQRRLAAKKAIVELQRKLS